MFGPLNPRLGYVLAFLSFVAVFSGAVWWSAYKEALDQLSRTAASDLALAADSLEGELSRYRSLSVVAADHPQVSAVLQEDAELATSMPFLLDIADKTGSLDVIVVDRAGAELAKASEFAPVNHAGRPYFERAMDGALGLYHFASDIYDHRAYVFAAPVFGADGPVVGAVVIVANIEAIEAEWRGARPALFFTDELGVVFVANRSELVFKSRTGDVLAAGRSAEYSAGQVSPFRPFTQTTRFGHELWQLDGGRYLPDRSLHLTLPVPVVGLTGEILLYLAPARQLAFLQAAVAGALCLAFGAMLFLATERRRTLAEANARLEARVADRTAELRTVNSDLRREVAERIDAEDRLRRAQADLVQAGKLSALGQMSAGISHELNQPLMAIRSFADNATAFLDKGDADTTKQNLGRISDLAHRMGRIIRNLRAFARQETVALQDVDMIAVVESAVEMAGPRLREADVTVEWDAGAGPLWVRGGDVRLQQVVLNLVTNAADAMAGADQRVLTLRVAVSGGRVVLTVSDTGPGLSDPEKLFEPFYSTKQVPSEEGMGLGLSISYGLVQSFGGEIKGRNRAGGGAEFTVELAAAERRQAA